MKTFKKGDRAVWRRQQRGLRRVTAIPVTIEGETLAGNYYVSWSRDGHQMSAIAMASNLEIPEEDGA